MRYVLSVLLKILLKIVLLNYFTENLPNVFLRGISEIDDKSKIAYIFKACWMSRGGQLPNSDNDRQEGERG